MIYALILNERTKYPDNDNILRYFINLFYNQSYNLFILVKVSNAMLFATLKNRSPVNFY